MHKDAKIIVKRYEYEEPYHLHLDISVSNGEFSFGSEFYFNNDDIIEIGEALSSYEGKIGSEYVYEMGSLKPKDRNAYYLYLKAHMTTPGEASLKFIVSVNSEEPVNGKAEFSIATETYAINRLGELFKAFSKLKHQEFHWSQDYDEMFEDIQY